MNLTDEEIDVLVIAEALPGFDGAWRLPPPPFELGHGEVAFRVVVAVRSEDGSGRARHLAALTRLPGGVPVLVFDPANGAPVPLRRALPIALSPFDRARGTARREARVLEQERILAGIWAPRRDPFPTPTLPRPPASVTTLHVERTPCASFDERCTVVAPVEPVAALVRPRQRVLFVDAEATLVLLLRHRLRALVRFTHVRSRWEALERLEYQAFDRILVVDRPPPASAEANPEPSLNRFYRAASALWPHIEPKFTFVVDGERLATMRARLADRFVLRDLAAVYASLTVGNAVPDPFR